MVKAFVTTIVFFLANPLSPKAQICNDSNSPKLGADTSLFVNCFQDVVNLTQLYNTTGLSTTWSTGSATSAKIGYYNLIATGSNGCKDTAYITVRQDVKKWLGTTDSNWHNPANWSGNAVPSEKTHTLIFGGTPYPCVISHSDAAAASIRVFKNGEYKIKEGRKIHIGAKCDTLPAYFEVGAKTIFIDNPTSQTIVSVDSAKIVFTGNTSQLRSMDATKIIVAGVLEKAPFGFLRKITDVKKDNDTYTVTTTDVPLETAFKELFFEHSQEYYGQDTTQQRKQNDESSGDLLSISVGLDYPLGDGAKAYGIMSVTPKLDFKLDISNYHLNYAKIEGSFNRQTTVGLNVDDKSNFSYEKKIFEKMMRPFVIPYTPLVVVPILNVTLGAEGNASIAFDASVTNSYSGKTWLEYLNGEWQQGSASNSENKSSFTGIDGNAEAKVYVQPYIDFKLYNQDWAKGTVTSQIYIRGEAHTLPMPSCKLAAGVTAGIAANLQMLGINFLNVSYPELLKYEKTLYECFKPKITALAFPQNSCDSMPVANITDTGSSRIVAKGFCWSTASEPTLSDRKKELRVDDTDITGGLGFYTDTLSGLKPDSTYFVRAFAINKTDTAYGDIFSFKPPIHIGDTLEGGIVFYVDSSCHHGLVCAIENQSDITKFQEGNFWSQTQDLITSDTLGSGSFNTDSIISMFGASGNIAALCRNYRGGNYIDWFLPSIDELKQIYLKKDIVSGMASIAYWSSSMLSLTGCCVGPTINVLNFTTGQNYYQHGFTDPPYIQANFCAVRAIRKF